MLIANFYSKPQGKLFRIFRDIILNIGNATIKDYLLKALEQKKTTLGRKLISTEEKNKLSLQECVRKKM